jgi:hypothetical protein
VIARVAADDPLAAFTRIGQLVAIAVTVAAVAIVVMRRSSFENLEYAA